MSPSASTFALTTRPVSAYHFCSDGIRASHVIVDRFSDVIILFADIVGFTDLASRVSPEALVVFLNEVFSKFDALADVFGLEKIKTIGDAYVAVSGLLGWSTRRRPNAPAELRPTGENARNNPKSRRCGPSAPVGC
jgi:class 3 adenylate cyclase